MYRHASAYRTVVRYGMQRIASLDGVPTPLKAIRTIQSNGAVATSRMKLTSMPSRPFTSTAPFSSASTDTSVPSVSSVSNPLLDSIASGDSRHFPLPRFSHIQPEHIRQLVDTFIPDMLAQFEAYEASLTRALASSSSSSSTLTYAKVIPPLVHLTDRMNYVFGTIDHLAAVKDTPPLREAVQAIQEERVKLNIRFGQSKPIYQALQQLSQHQQAQHLSPVQMKIIQDMLLEAHLSGVGLEGSSKDLFNSYLQRLSALSTSFAHHLLDAKVGLTVTDPRVMVGIPENMRALYALHARTSEPKIECATSENGPWRIGLSGVHFVPFMTHCSSRNHRELLYKAYITRASMYDGNDNRPILSEILLLRHSMSQLLGFPTYAHQSLATKMVNDPNEVEEFLEKLYQIALPKTRDDFNELQEFAYKNGLPRSSTLQSYDVAYYSDRLAKLKFNFDSEALRPYLPFDHVLNGLWQLVESLFHVRIAEHDPSEVGPGRKIDTWHTDVKYFDVYRLDPSTKERGPLIAGFYVDAYSRPSEKRGGAWMGECIGRAAVATAGADSKEVRLPVAFLICNQQPPTNGKPSQLSFDEMTTLFHEFGHVSQHILTTVDESSVAGIRGVEWDAVELASQFLENFCYDTQVLKTITKHVDTGASIPQELLDALLQSRNFRSASALMRQIQFATLDMKLHHTGVAPAMKKKNTKEQQSGEITPDAIAGVMPLIAQVERSVSDKCSVLPFDPQNKFLNSFSHIWAGGYSAGYYSYKWAEVMSCDAYEAFMELVDPRDSYETRLAKWSKLGLKYRATVLELGGSVKAKEVFRQFRGRDPSITPLLKQAGLIEEEKKQ